MRVNLQDKGVGIYNNLLIKVGQDGSPEVCIHLDGYGYVYNLDQDTTKEMIKLLESSLNKE